MSGSLQPVPLATLLPTTRASSGWVFNAAGALEAIGANIPRLDHDPATLAVRGVLIESERRNDIRNPRCEGAVAGTPGTAPTNWATFPTGGVVFNIVGSGTEAGIPYVDIRLSGTSTTGGAPVLRADQTYPTAAQNEVWTHSAFVRLVAGSLAGITNLAMFVTEWTAANAFVTQGSTNFTGITGGALSGGRISHTRTLTGATTGRAGTQIGWTPQISVAIDATFRIGAPQLELGAFASTPILPPAGAPAVSTRNRDVIARTLTASEWDGAGAFFIAEGIVTAQSGDRALVIFDDSTADRFIRIVIPSASNNVRLDVRAGGVLTSATLGSLTLGQQFRVAVRCVGGAFQGSLNGAAPVSNASAFPTGITTVRLGRFTATDTNMLAGHVRLLVLDRGIRSGASLQALSTVGAAYF
jgi:hypothetical protein